MRWSVLPGWTLLLGLAAAAPARPETPPRGVLLITLDTTRADKLGCYGGKGRLTPSLDALAAGATLFEHAQAPAPQTVPSHVTILSGWDPDRHGVRKNLETLLPPAVPLLQEAFQRRGYATGAFVSSMVLLPRFGLGRGFDAYDAAFYDPRRPEVNERRAADTLSPAAEWILARKGPWFCWVHLYDPHYPYVPPEPFAGRHRQAPYDGEVAYMDACLGEFLGRLGRAGVLGEALVAVCGDHGESLGEHGEDTHSIFVYDATTRIPLLLKLPGQTQGHRIAADVGLVDLAPTLRELCGLEGAETDGVSLVPLIAGAAGWRRKPVYIESLEPLYSYGWAPLYAQVDDRRKFILAPRSELYDLAGDPGERVNLLAKEPTAAKRMRETLAARLAAARTLSGGRLSLEAEELKSLQSLGYLSGTAGAAAATYKDPKEGAPLLRRHMEAVQLFQQGRKVEAAALFETILKRDPRNPLVCFYLGRCYEETDRDRSIAFLRKAVQLRRDFPQACAELLMALLEKNRAAEAWQLGQAALRETTDPEGEVRGQTAWAGLAAGRPEAEVLSVLDGAAGPAGTNPSLLKARAVLVLRRGDRDGALTRLEAVAGVVPPGELAALDSEPAFAPLREDPRFWKIVLKARRDSQGR